jgi:MHS family proline/betaine transporter-like MFS transporter
MGSFLEFGTLIGYVLGAGTVAVLTATLSNEALLSWGWRVPFLIAGPLGLVGLYIRMKLEETPAFKKQAEQREAEDKASRSNRSANCSSSNGSRFCCASASC